VIPLNEVERAYLAGIIDGEGTVTLTRQRRNETPVPTVSVANNNLELLKRIRRWLGGSIILKKKRKAHHNESYAWMIRHDKALRLLKDVQPYLIVKRPQAGLIIRKYKSVTHRAGRHTPELSEKKMRLVAEIRKLNKR
jgi:hypothetical protein